jgi:hypothetical protein
MRKTWRVNAARPCSSWTPSPGDAERLYERLGWQRVGLIHDCALLPHGSLCAITYFYHNLAGP